MLFGAPTVGKDTVTAILVSRDERFEHFVKHKHGQGSRHGYTMVTAAQLKALRNDGRIVSEVDRYGSTYAIELQRLEGAVADGRVTLVHSAEVAEAAALHQLGADIVVLECSRETAEERLEQRNADTVNERLQVWDLVSSKIEELAPITCLRVSTDGIKPDDLADQIMLHLTTTELFGDDG